MIVRDIRTLLEKLGPVCVKALERAVGDCVNRGHYEVRWEHVFHELLDESGSDIPVILRRFEADAATVRKALAAELEGLRTGNTGKPVFAPPLVELFEDAWCIASLGFGLDRIPSGALFISSLEKGRCVLASYYDKLRSIDPETLKGGFREIAAASTETFDARPEKGIAGTGSLTPEAAAECLRAYCTNFTDDARSGVLDPIVGRDDEIRSALDILSRRRKNNPILVGEAGVGKTAVVEGLAQRIATGDVPEHLKNVEIWGLDLGLLQAGASVKGEFEKRLKTVIDAVKSSPRPAILFIDEAHTLIGAGGAAGQNDAANLLKPALARGELRTLAATTWSEYRKYFEKDPALARRFQVVMIDEPDEERCAAMLRGVAASYERFHGVTIASDGIRAAVAYSHRYLSGRQLPDKAVDVLDTACTRVKMSRSVKPAKLDSKERSLAGERAKRAALEKDLSGGIAVRAEEIAASRETIASFERDIARLTEQWNKERTLAKEADEARDALQAARDNNETEAVVAPLEKVVCEAENRLAAAQGDEPMAFSRVTAPLCAQVIADWTGIPVVSMVKNEAAALLSLEDALRERVLGQDAPIRLLADAMRAAKTGMTNPDTPLGVFLFTGPSGVGKTELALALADVLFGGDKFLTVINMSEYQEKHTVSQLKGSPPGYVGYGEGGVLTEAVRQKPYSVVLLDEVEKAHIEVMNLFYQAFDKGLMRDGEGRAIDFRNTVIIMTSNLASDRIIDCCAAVPDASDRELVDAAWPALVAHFRPALLGRCTVVPFRPLSGEALRDIVALKLDKVARRIYDLYRMKLCCSPAVMQQIVEACGAVETGARNAQAIIDRRILPALSRQLLARGNGEENRHTGIQLSVTKQGDIEIVFTEEGRAAGEDRTRKVRTRSRKRDERRRAPIDNS